MTGTDALRFFHIVFVLVFFSGTIVVITTMSRARREPNIHAVRTLVRLANHAGLYLVTPPLVIAAILGVFSAKRLHIPLTDTGWLNAAYAATALAVLLGLVMGAVARRAARLADRDAQNGSRSPELDAALASPLPMIVGPALHALVTYIIVLMVFQPFT